MSSNINEHGEDHDVAMGACRRTESFGFRRVLATILSLGLAPLAMWLIGTAMVRVSPPVYQAEAILRLPAAGSAGELIDSPAVIESAAMALAAGGRPDPMAQQVLRSNLSLEHCAGTGVIKVAATGHHPQEARRTLMAVVASYERQHAGSGTPLLVYAAPTGSAPVGVPHGMRMVLGCAGLALLGLLLSIPLLRRLEGVPLLESGRELVSAIARASAAAGLPRVAGFLPAAQPAG